MIVFAGPSIAGLDVSAHIELDIRPPARQGDVYLASLEEPTAIGIIDGYFEGVPSVWHKEILWAITCGIPIFGASSMGALRAAELDGFGMIGVGVIYEGYRDGIYEDDDEVALLHGPAEIGYPSLSLAMVNARATLDAAKRAGVMTAEQAIALTLTAKTIFYKNRTWQTVFERAKQQDMSWDVCDPFEDWIKEHAVDQKREDAEVLLKTMLAGEFEAFTPNFHFEETDLWLNTSQYWEAKKTTTPYPKSSGYSLFADKTLF